MSNIGRSRKALVRRILEGAGKAAQQHRRAAFENERVAEPLSQLVDRVAKNARGIALEDFDRIKQSGLNEDQVFEIVVCAVVGQATRQYETAMAALIAAQES